MYIGLKSDYLDKLKVSINTKVKLEKSGKVFDLFSERQIKFFNSLSEDDLYDYLNQLYDYFFLKEDFMYGSSNLIFEEEKLSSNDDECMLIDRRYKEDEHTEWLKYGCEYDNSNAIHNELKRVILEYETNEVSKHSKTSHQVVSDVYDKKNIN